MLLLVDVSDLMAVLERRLPLGELITRKKRFSPDARITQLSHQAVLTRKVPGVPPETVHGEAR